MDALKLNSQQISFVYNKEFQRTSTTFPVGSPALTRTESYTTLHQRFRTSFNHSAIDGTLWRNYWYDGRGRIAQEDRKSGSLTKSRVFGYTPQGELERLEESTTAASVSCPEPSGTEDVNDGTNCVPSAERTVQADYRFQYDSAGNLRRQEDLVTSAVVSGTHPTANRIASWGAETYQHDADGHRTTKTAGGVTRTYAWSADGRLLSVASGSTTLSYDYDAFGQVIRRTRNGVAERYYLWDDGHLMAELTGNAMQRVAEYVYAGGMDNPVAIVTGATAIAATRYFEEDELGNVIGVFGSALAQTLRYDARGKVEEITGALADTNRLRWKGLVWEGDIAQLYYVRHRWYDPETGRFMTEDPLGLAGGLNVYGFAGNDLINGIDPQGLSPCSAVGGRSHYHMDGHDHFEGDNVAHHRRWNGKAAVLDMSDRHSCPSAREQSGENWNRSARGYGATSVLGSGETSARFGALRQGMQCTAAALAFGANTVMSGFVVLGTAEILVGVLAGEAAVLSAGILGGEASLAAAGALFGNGVRHIATGVAPSALTAVGIGGDLGADNFSWKSLVPIVGIPSAIDAVARHCPELW